MTCLQRNGTESLFRRVFSFSVFTNMGEEKGIFAGIQGTPNTFSASSQFGRNTNEHFLTLLRTIHEKDKKITNLKCISRSRNYANSSKKSPSHIWNQTEKWQKAKILSTFPFHFLAIPIFRSKHAK